MTLRCPLFAAVIVTVVTVVTGCAPGHVRLASLPPDGATLEARRGFYEQNRPIVVRTADAIPAGVGARQRSFVVLNDGTRVEHAHDLLAHVAPTSATGLAAARAQEAEDRATLQFTAGSILTGVGVALMAPMIGTGLVEVELGTENEVRMAISATGLVGSVSVLLGAGTLAFAQGSASIAAQERDAAFAQYGRSLRQQLGLSADDVSDTVAAAPDANGIVVVRAPALR
jgi:hypothetical protein